MKIFNLVWALFFFLLIAFSPFWSIYFLQYSPEWFYSFGWDGFPHINHYWHTPSIITTIFLDVLLFVVAIAPFNKWYLK